MDHRKPSKKLTKPEVTLESLYRIFTVPEGEDSTLGQIEQRISKNLMGFLKETIVASDISPAQLEKQFSDAKIPEDPVFVSEQAEFLISKVVSQSVHTAAPTFIGHMTSALPYFMLPLSKMMIALNQNLVKIETSKAFTPLERQVIGMLHRLVYRRDDSFYKKRIQDHESALGAFCSNGTIANITSLWVALNRLMPKDEDFGGVGEEGMFAAIQHYGFRNIAIIVSERGHYSLKKTANLLGIGKKNLVSIPVDQQNKMRIDLLKAKVQELKEQNIGIAAIVGIAGTTETGNIDPLQEIAVICRTEGIHFHVDAAWGGPTLFSTRHAHLLAGIEEADSVTFDGHKQLYVPMGAAFALFRSESLLRLVEHHAEYIIRKGSRDIGRTTLEGSRPGMAMLVHSGLRIMGRRGYEMLIDTGLQRARLFANMIREAPDFELITEPELNILTYRYIPKDLQEYLVSADEAEICRVNEHLNHLTVTIQKEQREQGKSFVSRTVLKPERYFQQKINVFRVVLANPLTTPEHLFDILEEQRILANRLMKAEFAWMRQKRKKLGATPL
ncbi:MAG: pyridoxal-dependent aspartate 1-decarboxylase PanP [Oligoflexus sp.]